MMKYPFPITNPPMDKDRLEGCWQEDAGSMIVGFDSRGYGHAASLGWSTDRFVTEEVRYG
jgi:hypothetical protein